MEMNREVMGWTRAKELPSREEIQGLYKSLVCEDCNDMAISTLSSGALIRSICVAVYYQTLDAIDKWKVVYYLSQAFGMSERAVQSYLPTRTYKYVNIIQIKGHFKVAQYDNIIEASSITGIPQASIRKAICNGGSAYGFRFEAETSKPVLRYPK